MFFVFLWGKKLIEMKKILIVIISFCFFTTNAQIGYKLKNEKPSSTNLFGEVAMLEVEYWDNGGFLGENITTYILGLSSTININKNFDLIGSFGVSEGFSYNFATSNLALKLSDNFHLFYGIGTYYIYDEKWNPKGLDGNEPSRYDFGMNMGLQLQLSEYLGLIMRYNILEEKEEESIGSMSINGLSFGLILK